MKLIRFGDPGKEKPGVIFPDGSLRDVSKFTVDFNESFFENDGLSQLQKWIEENNSSLPLINKDTRLGPPIAKPSKIICVGLNYAKHA